MTSSCDLTNVTASCNSGGQIKVREPDVALHHAKTLHIHLVLVMFFQRKAVEFFQTIPLSCILAFLEAGS